MIATVALTLAVLCALVWVVERRNLANLAFCVIAIATAFCIPAELGMMHASSAAQYGAWLRWYHLPMFFVLIGQVLFVYYYLGRGRLWLLGLIILLRLVILTRTYLKIA